MSKYGNQHTSSQQLASDTHIEPHIEPHNTVSDRDSGMNGDEARICPLTLAPVGQRLRLCQLCKGRRLAKRLAELGLTPGVSLSVVQDAGGPLLISVRNSRVALGRGLADRLQVEVLDESGSTRVDEATECPWWKGYGRRLRGWRGRGVHNRRGRGLTPASNHQQHHSDNSLNSSSHAGS